MTTIRKTVSVVLIATLVTALCGCGEEHRSDSHKPIRLGPIYTSAITGAIIGGIVGHQSEEPGEGAAVGAVIFGVGALLGEIDRANKHRHHEEDDEDEHDEDELVFHIRSADGSETPVVLRKKGGNYVGPNGEHYDRLPTAEQLRPVYGS